MIPQTSPSNPQQKQNKYSPIILPQSPANVSPQKNLTGLPRVARDIAADIYNNIQKWNDQHVLGAKIVQQIVNIKADNDKMYPSGLEECMAELFDVLQKISIYSNALIFLNSQMAALVKLHKQPAPLFISLTIDQLSELARAIADAYKAEFKAKQYILENIAHSHSKQEVMYFASSWIYQRNITTAIHLKLETMLTETGHRKAT